MPIDWDRMHYELTGKPMEGPEPEFNQVVRDLGLDLLRILKDNGLHSEIVKVFTEEARKRGVPPSYVWWTLSQTTSFWPSDLAPIQMRLLMFARGIISYHGYDASINVPQVPDDEDLFDVAFKNSANQLAKSLSKVMARYDKLLAKHGKVLARVDSHIDRSEGPRMLRSLMKIVGPKWANQWWGADGDLIRMFLSVMP